VGTAFSPYGRATLDGISRISEFMKRTTKRQRVLNFALELGWTRIGESEWAELRRAMPDVSPTVIRTAGLPIEAPWCGVHQHTLEELEESLTEFSAVYEARPDLRRLCREQVIADKDRAKWWSVRSNDKETRQRKTTMAEWMLVWLGDPAIFPVWVRTLKRLS
jgi:hypothetical protein